MDLEEAEPLCDLHLWVITKAMALEGHPRGVCGGQEEQLEADYGCQPLHGPYLLSDCPTCHLPLHQGLTGAYTNLSWALTPHQWAMRRSHSTKGSLGCCSWPV